MSITDTSRREFLRSAAGAAVARGAGLVLHYRRLAAAVERYAVAAIGACRGENSHAASPAR